MTTRVGLLMSSDLSLDDWATAGRKLARIADSTSWCLGDWLAHGQLRFSGRYQRAAAEIGLDTQTLRNYAWLARKFAHERRRPGLSLQHHAEVASLPVPEQDHWLDLAERERWSRNELRRRIREARRATAAEKPAVDTADAAGPSYLPRLPVALEELARWREAAEQTATDFHTWVVRTLNAAAHGEAHDGGGQPPEQIRLAPTEENP
ncbi:LmbU family transcriptional regulator [Streptomyces enissocaesilis]|uniref:LmbU family transcriptional regulator n=1 Tax=Streptomyces enissocaesilis TaxID=332589 RepID=UPI003CD0BB57